MLFAAEILDSSAALALDTTRPLLVMAHPTEAGQSCRKSGTTTMLTVEWMRLIGPLLRLRRIAPAQTHQTRLATMSGLRVASRLRNLL